MNFFNFTFWIKKTLARKRFKKALLEWEIVMETYGSRARVSKAPYTVFNARTRAFDAYDKLKALDPSFGRWIFKDQILFEMKENQ